jgi:hypothetical protein
MPRVVSKTSGLHRPAWPRPVSVIEKSIGQTLRDVLFISAQPGPEVNFLHSLLYGGRIGRHFAPRLSIEGGGQPSPAQHELSPHLSTYLMT